MEAAEAMTSIFNPQGGLRSKNAASNSFHHASKSIFLSDPPGLVNAYACKTADSQFVLQTFFLTFLSQTSWNKLAKIPCFRSLEVLVNTSFHSCFSACS